MPNTKSAKKRHTQSIGRRARNRATKSILKTEIRKVREAIAAGNVEVGAAELRVAAMAAEPATLTVKSYRETRSVGMLVLEDEGGRAASLAVDLHERLERLGVYERERRPWLPHLTVIRFRERPRLRPPLPELGPFSPSDAAVYMSTLRPAGAQYSVLESVGVGR